MRDPSARILLAALGQLPAREWLDDNNSIRLAITAGNHERLLNAIGLNVDQASALLSIELRKSLIARLTENVTADPDDPIRKAIEALDAGALSSAEIRSRVHALFEPEREKMRAFRRRQRFDTGPIYGGMVFFAVSACLAMVIGGPLRTVFGF